MRRSRPWDSHTWDARDPKWPAQNPGFIYNSFWMKSELSPLNHPLFKNIIPFTLTFSRSLSGTGQRTPKVLERHLQGPAVFIKRMWRYFQGQQDINNIQQVVTKTKIWTLLISLTVISPNSSCVRTWPSRRPLSKLPPHHRTEEFLGRLTCPGWVRIFWSCVSELWKLF